MSGPNRIFVVSMRKENVIIIGKSVWNSREGKEMPSFYEFEVDGDIF